MAENTEKKTGRIKSAAAGVMAAAWMCVIFWFSAQTQEESGAVSLGLSYRMVDAAGRLLHLGLDDAKVRAAAGAIEYFVRKGAHMAEYAVLALLLYGWLSGRSMSRRRRIGWAVWTAVFYACTDEFHQLFVAGRAGRISDVLVDSVGAVLGLVLFLSAQKIVGKVR